MTERKPRRSRLLGVALAAIVGSALSGTAVAATQEADWEPGWSLRFYAAAIDFDGGPTEARPILGRGGYDIDWGGGVGVNAEYRFSRRLGFELGALAGAGVDVVTRTVRFGNQTWLVRDTVEFTPLTAGLDIHLTPDARVDLYVTPMVAWVMYGRGVGWISNTGITSNISFDDDLAPGAAIGLGVPFGERRWSFHATVTYLDSALTGNGPSIRIDDDYDMAIIGVGFGYRF